MLVIGGGLAGCWAAIRARESGRRVILVERGKVSRSGKSSFSGAGILCPLPGDNLDAWKEEIVVRGEYMADQDAVDVLLQEQPDRIRQMQDWGLGYERDEKGAFVRVPALGAVEARVVTVSSQEMMEVLRERMVKAGVDLLERVFVVDLLTSDGAYPTSGAVNGCYGFHTRTGEPCVISARATVLATGGVGYFYFTGDGVAMGYRAGAEVWGMEFVRTMDQMTFHEKYSDIHLITFQRFGMRLYNRLGERFLERYYPGQAERTTRHQMAIAVIMENLEGRGPVYADLTHLDAAGLNKLRTLPSTAPRVACIEREGVDFGRDRIAFNVHSGFINAESGGLKHGLNGETRLPGLYVAGEVGGYPANGTTSPSVKLASCCVEGYRAGSSAARFASETAAMPANQDQVKYLAEASSKPIKAGAGMAVEDLMDHIYEYLRPARVSIFRDEATMRKLIREQQNWMAAISTCRARDWHELVKVYQKRNYIECIGLVFASSLERTETRGMNLRVDYPFRDDAGWLKHVIIGMARDGPRLRHESIPMARYQVKPDRFEKVPARIQWPGPAPRNGD